MDDGNVTMKRTTVSDVSDKKDIRCLFSLCTLSVPRLMVLELLLGTVAALVDVINRLKKFANLSLVVQSNGEQWPPNGRPTAQVTRSEERPASQLVLHSS